MKTYTSNGGGAGALATVSNEATGVNDESIDASMVSIISSPAQSPAMSMDFPSDPAQHHDSPDVGSLMDEDDAKYTLMTPQPQPIYHHTSEPASNTWPPV
jgi:hypothetical protein